MNDGVYVNYYDPKIDSWVRTNFLGLVNWECSLIKLDSTLSSFRLLPFQLVAIQKGYANEN